jgi:copper chaperone CopZ
MATETTFEVRGMDCTGCEDRIKTALGRLDGVIKADTEHTAAQVTVRFDEWRLSEADVKQRIRSAGYEVA